MCYNILMTSNSKGTYPWARRVMPSPESQGTLPLRMALGGVNRGNPFLVTVPIRQEVSLWERILAWLLKRPVNKEPVGYVTKRITPEM